MRIVDFHIPSLIELGKPFTVAVSLNEERNVVIELRERRSGAVICRYEGYGKDHVFKCVAYGAPGTHIIDIVAKNPTHDTSTRSVIVSFTTPIPLQYILPTEVVTQIGNAVVATAVAIVFISMSIHLMNFVMRLFTVGRRAEEERHR